MSYIPPVSRKFKSTTASLSFLIFTFGLTTSLATYSSDRIWSNSPSFTGSFPRIPISITVDSPPYAITYTTIYNYTSSDCSGGGGGIGFGSGSYTVSQSGPYFLGLNNFTSYLHGNGARSITATVGPDMGTQYSTSCIPISCSDANNCTATTGTYTLHITNGVPA